MMGKAAGHAGVRMPAHRSFERELAQLEALSGRAPDADGVERVRLALRSENNYLVAKAAGIVADCSLAGLLPEVLSADVCSLKADEDRAALACHMQISKTGEIKPFEALLRVKVTHGVPVITDLVAVRKGVN